MILTGATNLRVGSKQAISAALRNSSFASFWIYLQTTISTVISGPIGLIKYGTATLILTGNNTYNGTTTINSGVLNIRNNNALGSSVGETIILTGAALQIQGGLTITGKNLSIFGGGVSSNGALRSTSGNNTWTGNITANTLNMRIASDLNLLTITGGITCPTGTSALFQGNGNITVSGIISGGGPVSTSSLFGATSVLTLSDNNTFTGTMSINRGIVSVSSIKNFGVASGLGAAASSAIFLGQVANSGTLLYTGTGDTSNRTFQIGLNSTTPSAIDTGSGVIQNDGAGALVFSATNFNSTQSGTLASRTLTLTGSNTSNNTISGIIRNNAAGGIVGIIKNGTGLWILSGLNTYTGATSILAGELRTTALISGTTGKFFRSDFTNTTLTVTFSVAPVAGETYRLFPGATIQTYASVSLFGAPGRTASYNSTNSTLTIA